MKLSLTKLTLCVCILIIDIIHFRHIYLRELRYYLVVSHGQKLVADEDSDNKVKNEAIRNNKDVLSEYVSGIDKWMKV